MRTSVTLVSQRIEERWRSPEPKSGSGATVEFRGCVRDRENGQSISALDYEAYETMALRMMERILDEEAMKHPCEQVVVIHRHGRIPVGDTAILVWIEARHRGEAFALLAAFMDRLKTDVPIWKAGFAPC
ncbi:MAG: molybdenum cofactor biosynthesis protein MoaE [Terrimicrobiaceae bacterium]|nr:molybdenum cofactor biosynthesis protein MoaE [Terrimicrobiaceae bacterium]